MGTVNICTLVYAMLLLLLCGLFIADHAGVSPRNPRIARAYSYTLFSSLWLLPVAGFIATPFLVRM